MFLLYSMLYAFFLFGLSDNMRGPALPGILEALHLPYSKAGILLSASPAGFLAGTILAPYLIAKCNYRVFLLWAGIAISAGLLLMGSQWHWGYNWSALFILCIGLGFLEVGGNSIVAQTPGKRGAGFYLNLSSIMHSIGVISAPLIGFLILSFSLSWNWMYWSLVPFSFLFLTMLAFSPIPSYISPPMPLSKEKVFRSSRFWPWAWALCAYLAFEVGVASWIVQFLQTDIHLSKTQATLAFGLYGFCIILGRFIGMLFMDKIGFRLSLILSLVGASVCLSCAFLSPHAWPLLILSGLFWAGIFPGATGGVIETFPHLAEKALARLFAFAGLITTFSTIILAYLAEHYGLATAMQCVLVLIAPTIALFFLINTKKAS